MESLEIIEKKRGGGRGANQWFIAGTPMTARAHAAHCGLRLLLQMSRLCVK